MKTIALLCSLICITHLSAQECIRQADESAETFAKRVQPRESVNNAILVDKVLETKLWNDTTAVIIAFYNVPKNNPDNDFSCLGYVLLPVRQNVYKAVFIDHFFAPTGFDSACKIESVFFANADRDEGRELLILTSEILGEEDEMSGTFYYTSIFDNIDFRHPPKSLKHLTEFEGVFEDLEGEDSDGEPRHAEFKNAATIKEKLKAIRHQYGYDFYYPVIASKGNRYADFIPAGWELLDSAFGDLNKDQQTDAVLILQHKALVNRVEHSFDESDTIKSRPRIILILFRNKTGKGFYKAEQNDSFIFQHDNPDAEDPYSDISIAKGVLKVDFRFFMNIGSWGASSISYKFRYQNASFLLIGEDYYSRQRNTGESSEYSINYLTGKKCTTQEELPDLKPVTECKTIVVQPQTLKTMKHSF